MYYTMNTEIQSLALLVREQYPVIDQIGLELLSQPPFDDVLTVSLKNQQTTVSMSIAVQNLEEVFAKMGHTVPLEIAELAQASSRGIWLNLDTLADGDFKAYLHRESADTELWDSLDQKYLGMLESHEQPGMLSIIGINYSNGQPIEYKRYYNLSNGQIVNMRFDAQGNFINQRAESLISLEESSLQEVLSIIKSGPGRYDIRAIRRDDGFEYIVVHNDLTEQMQPLPVPVENS